MLKNYRVFLAVLSCFLMLTACEKEFSVENGIPGGGGGGGLQGSFRAKIDGVQWIANSMRAASRVGGVIAISGSSSDGKLMVLRVADSGVHVYKFLSTSSTNAGAFQDSALAPIASLTTNQWVVDSTYGTLNITSIDDVRKTMSGTFSMYVIRALDGIKRNITEGVFTDISFASTLPPPSASDSFKVKVDGTEFIETNIFAIEAMGNINVSAMNSTGATVGITIPKTVTPGTYALDFVGGMYIGQYNPNDTTYLVADPGTITVLENNPTTKRVRATFSFTAHSIVGTPVVAELTEGSFSVIYQ